MVRAFFADSDAHLVNAGLKRQTAGKPVAFVLCPRHAFGRQFGLNLCRDPVHLLSRRIIYNGQNFELDNVTLFLLPILKPVPLEVDRQRHLLVVGFGFQIIRRCRHAEVGNRQGPVHRCKQSLLRCLPCFVLKLNY